MFSLKSLLVTVVLVIPIVVFVYFYIKKIQEVRYFDVAMIAGLLWVCGFVFTFNFGGIIFAAKKYIQILMGYLFKYF